MPVAIWHPFHPWRRVYLDFRAGTLAAASISQAGWLVFDALFGCDVTFAKLDGRECCQVKVVRSLVEEEEK